MLGSIKYHYVIIISPIRAPCLKDTLIRQKRLLLNLALTLGGAYSGKGAMRHWVGIRSFMVWFIPGTAHPSSNILGLRLVKM